MTLHNSGVIRYQPHIQKEIEIAIHDLVEKNYFKPQPSFFGEGHIGPYDIRVFVDEGRVIIDISGKDKAKLGELDLSVRPLKKVIKEYFNPGRSPAFRTCRSRSKWQCQFFFLLLLRLEALWHTISADYRHSTKLESSFDVLSSR